MFFFRALTLKQQMPKAFRVGKRDPHVIVKSGVASPDDFRQRAPRDADLRSVETMLLGQAAALNAIFAEMARRSGINMGQYMDVADRRRRQVRKPSRAMPGGAALGLCCEPSHER